MNLPFIELPPHSGEGSISVDEALEARKTTREIKSDALPLQLVSDLLWAACGINRDQGPFKGTGITAASASNAQEIDVYVLREEGAYRYEAKYGRLLPVVEGDLRIMAIGKGQAGFGAKAPLRLVFVADTARLAAAPFQEPGLKDPEVQKAYYYVDTGLIAANVALFAASRGLGAWFHNCDKAGLSSALGLAETQRALFGQTIGYPAD